MENKEVIELLKDAFELKRQEKYKQAMELLYKALTLSPDNTEILSQVADIHILLDNPTSAISIYERLIEKRPDDVFIISKLVLHYLNSFNYDKAKVLLSKFILSYPSEEAYSVYFSSLLNMNEPDTVIEFYQEKSLANYHSDTLNKYYGFALCRTQKYQEAISVLAKIALKNSHDEDIQYYYAYALYQLGLQNEAYNTVSKFLNSTTNAKLINLCGEIELNKNNYERAISLFSMAIKHKYDGLYFYNLATAYFLNGQLNEARIFYTKAISASPDVDEYRYAQAYLYYKQGELNKSQQLLTEILGRNPQFKEAMLLLVDIYYDENKFYRAEKELNFFVYGDKEKDENYLKAATKIAKALYKKAQAIYYQEKLVELCPQNSDYRFELSRLYFDSAKYENAAKLVISVISDNPKYVNAYILAAKIYLKMYDFVKSITMVDRVLALDLNNEEAFYIKALCYVGLQQFEEAISVLKKLLDYNPHKPEAYALIASCYTELGIIENAVAFYNEAILLDNKNAQYFMNLALIMQKINNSKEYLRYLYVAHTLKPDNNEIRMHLIDGYVSEKHYKQAMALLYSHLDKTVELEYKKEIRKKITEIDNLYKQSVNFIKYWIWKLFKI